jgi:hypothetical protein
MENSVETIVRDDASNEKQRIGSVGSSRCATSSSLFADVSSNHSRLAEHDARGNTEKETQISARLHDGKAVATQREQSAVRLD